MPLKTQVDDPPTMNLIPMVDMMFNLIIFLLATTTFASMERNIGLKVPEVIDKGSLTAAPERKVINVFRDGHIEIDDLHGSRRVSLEDLTRWLSAKRAQYADLGVIVRGDGQGAFQHVAEVLNACKQAGIKELGITVRLTTSEK
jgi:biopolymer transport protein ExbD